MFVFGLVSWDTLNSFSTRDEGNLATTVIDYAGANWKNVTLNCSALDTGYDCEEKIQCDQALNGLLLFYFVIRHCIQINRSHSVLQCAYIGVQSIALS